MFQKVQHGNRISNLCNRTNQEPIIFVIKQTRNPLTEVNYNLNSIFTASNYYEQVNFILKTKSSDAFSYLLFIFYYVDFQLTSIHCISCSNSEMIDYIGDLFYG